jgi:hypothetical protein
MADANGKRYSAPNQRGELVYDEWDIYRSCDRDKFVIGHGISLNVVRNKEHSIIPLYPNISRKTRSSEYKLPFYIDLTLLAPQPSTLSGQRCPGFVEM